MCHMDSNPCIHELGQIGPVTEVASATVDFVDDDSGSRAIAQELYHRVELGPASLGGRFLLLKPSENNDGALKGIAFDRGFLFLERHSFPLSWR